MHSMAEWYMRGEQHDQIRLSRILDVAQDLKVWIYMEKKQISELQEFFFKVFTLKLYWNTDVFNHFVFFIQALSMLLNATPFAFVIDLACLASRREYLKLDKWLSDKIREHGVS